MVNYNAVIILDSAQCFQLLYWSSLVNDDASEPSHVCCK